MRCPRFLAIAVLSIFSLRAENPKLASDLTALLSDLTKKVDVIVQYDTPPDLSDIADLKGNGGSVKMQFDNIPAAVITISVGRLNNLTSLLKVKHISLDHPIAGLLDYTAATVGADLAWRAGLDGTGVGVAVIDSGIANHPDLQAAGVSRVVYQENFIDNESGDSFGHGTHVAGIVGGNGNASTGGAYKRTFKGIAPGVSLIDLRVLDKNGMSSDSVVIAALDRVIQLRKRYNIRVVNLSLGRQITESYQTDPLCKAVEQVWRSGVVVVIAAGNDGRRGYSSILAPGNSPSAITVGAMKTMTTVTRTDDNIASYSSKGPSALDLVSKPDLVAPGNLTISLLAPGSTLANAFPGNVVATSDYSAQTGMSSAYFRLSGTSMATPVVSGTAALLIQKDPSLSPDTVKARLMKTASKKFPTYSYAYDPTTKQSFVSTYDLYTVGAGYLDVAAAISNNDVANGSAASPSLVPIPLVGITYLTNTALPGGTLAIWGTNGPFSNMAVWGTLAIWGTNNPFSTLAIWGTTAPWGALAIWGTNTPTGTLAIWGTSNQGYAEQ